MSVEQPITPSQDNWVGALVRFLNNPVWLTPVPLGYRIICSERLIGIASGDVLWLVKCHGDLSPLRRKAVRAEGASNKKQLSPAELGIAEEP